MNTITLAVTKKSLDYIKETVDKSSWQITIKDAAPELRHLFNNASKSYHIPICVGESLNLAVRDTHSIWRSHNREHEKEFDALFELLALNPDKPMVFICKFTGCIL